MRFCPLWNTSLCFCLLEMSQVTDFHRGLEVFFSFSIASRGPCGVVSSSLSVMTAVLLAGSLQSILTYLSLSCPYLIPWQYPCSHAPRCPADPNWIWVVVPVLRRCWDMKFFPCTPGSCNGFSGIFIASSLAMILLGKASPQAMIWNTMLWNVVGISCSGTLRNMGSVWFLLFLCVTGRLEIKV